MKRRLAITCQPDKEHSKGRYKIYCSDMEKNSDKRRISGIYILEDLFKISAPELINVEIEWFGETPYYYSESGNDSRILTFYTLSFECFFYREYGDHYSYRTGDGGYREINSFYIKKDILGDNPPDKIYVTLRWD